MLAAQRRRNKHLETEQMVKRLHLSNEMTFNQKNIESTINPSYSIKSYTNGYYFFLTEDHTSAAIVPRDIPYTIRNELALIGRERMI